MKLFPVPAPPRKSVTKFFEAIVFIAAVHRATQRLEESARSQNRNVVRLETEAGGGQRGVQTPEQSGQIQNSLEIVVQDVKRTGAFVPFRLLK